LARLPAEKKPKKFISEQNEGKQRKGGNVNLLEGFDQKRLWGLEISQERNRRRARKFATAGPRIRK